jgi:hypothetical protein
MTADLQQASSAVFLFKYKYFVEFGKEFGFLKHVKMPT